MALKFIITYADNNKFEDFFRKQGFGDSEIHPFINESYICSKIMHYKRATLCACRVYENIDYKDHKFIL